MTPCGYLKNEVNHKMQGEFSIFKKVWDHIPEFTPCCEMFFMKHFCQNTSESGILFYLTCPQTSQTALKRRIMYFMWAPFLMLPRFSCAQEERSVISEDPGSDMVCVHPNPSMSLQLKEDGDRGLPVIWIAKGCHQSFSKFLPIPTSWPYRSSGSAAGDDGSYL